MRAIQGKTTTSCPDVPRRKQTVTGELLGLFPTWGNATVLLSTFHTGRFHNVVHHLENHYVCILNSEVLPNADTPLIWTGKGEHEHNDVSWQFQAEVALPLESTQHLANFLKLLLVSHNS